MSSKNFFTANGGFIRQVRFKYLQANCAKFLAHLNRIRDLQVRRTQVDFLNVNRFCLAIKIHAD